MKNEDLKYIENSLSRIKKINVKILNKINTIEDFVGIMIFWLVMNLILAVLICIKVF